MANIFSTVMGKDFKQKKYTNRHVNMDIILAQHKPAFPVVVILTFQSLFCMIVQAQKGMSYNKPAHSGTSPLQFPGHQNALQLSGSIFSLSSLAFWMITLNGIVSGHEGG